MPYWRNVAKSFLLLGARQRKLYLLAILLQSSLSLLDLVGVMLSGLISLIASKSITGKTSSGLIENIEELPLISNLSDMQILFVFSCLTFIFFILKTLLSLYFSRRVFKFLAHQQREIAAKIYSNLFQRNVEWLDSENPMDIAIRTVVGSAMATINALGQSLIIVSETFLLLLFGIILLALNPVLTITSLVYLIIVIFCINILLSKRITQFGEELGKLRISIQSRILETLKLRREILLLGRERFFYEGVSKQFEYQARSFSGDIWLQQTPKYIIEISLMLGTFGFISILLLTDNNVVGIPVLVIFLASASRIFPSLLRIQNSLLNLKSFNYLSGGAIELSERLMSRTHSQLPANFDKKIYKESRGAHTKIELKDVSFNHQGMNDPLFDGLNCTIEPGEKIALIGPSGSGKTTFINLILGFHKISGGSLKIGGINCEEWIALNPAKIGYVPQDFHFVSGTLLENICLGIYEDSIDYHKLAEAMHKSNLTQFVNSLPQGIKTFMGPHGQSFSGGQKQRILLARALYDRPEILVLDEGTSSLDAETESVIVSNILNETSSQTVLFVAHRLSAIRSFARILYFENGRIYADGSFDYLVDTIPEFSLQLKLLGIID